jgi:hypothetical protein
MAEYLVNLNNGKTDEKPLFASSASCSTSPACSMLPA